MHSVEYHSSLGKDLKNLDKPAALFFKQEILSVIADNPYKGQLLHGEFRKYRKYAFSFSGVAYRIAYEIKSNGTVVLLILIGTRENFYKELKKRVKSRPALRRTVHGLASALFLAVLAASLALAPWVARGQCPALA